MTRREDGCAKASLEAVADEQRGAFARLTAAILVGIVVGLLAVILTIGCVHLIFANHLPSLAPLLIGAALLSTALIAGIVSLTSSIKASVAPVQEIPCVAMGAVVGATVSGMSAADGEVYLTVLVTVALGTLITGAVMIFLGSVRCGEIIRFIPYPVIGGFLGGTGWLILLGGLGIVLAVPANLTIFTSIPESFGLIRLGLAGLFIFVLVWARRRYSSPLILPLAILVAVLFFGIAIVLTGASHANLHENGWLVALPESGQRWHAFDLRTLEKVDWRAVGMGMVQVPALVVLTVIGVLLNATSIELEQRDDVDLNREMKAVGAANAVAGLFGGVPGFQAVSLTLLAKRLGADSRLVGVIAAATVLAVLWFGIEILDIFPTLVIGGLLIWIGGSLMIDWLFRQAHQHGAWDHAIVVLIFFVIVAVGMAEGILVGLFAAVGLFIYQYARVDFIRHTISGRDLHSGFGGSQQRQELLRQHGDAILIVRLQGFLFFGTANRLRRRLQERIRQLSAKGSGYLIIDFQRVTGIDSSATSSFMRLEQIAAQYDVTMVLTGLDDAMRRALLSGDRGDRAASAMRIEPNLGRGVRWCENALLARVAEHLPTGENRSISTMLQELVQDTDAAEAIGRYCERGIADAGMRLIEQGASSKDFYFIESGHASVDVADDDENSFFLATLGAGDVFGEIAFYLDEKRSASVVAEDQMVVWKLTSEAVERLQSEAPDAALRFHRSVAAMLAGRLVQTNRLVSVLEN